MANLLDFFLLLPFGILLAALSHESAISFFVWPLIFVIVSNAYFILSHKFFGQTLGKYFAGIKVLDEQSFQLPSFLQALQRNSVDLGLSFIRLTGIYYGLWALQNNQFEWNDWPYILPRIRALDPVLPFIGGIILVWYFSESLSLFNNPAKKSYQDDLGGTVVKQISPPKFINIFAFTSLCLVISMSVYYQALPKFYHQPKQIMLSGSQIDYKLMQFWKDTDVIDVEDQVIFFHETLDPAPQKLLLASTSLIYKNNGIRHKFPIQNIKMIKLLNDFGGQIDLVVEIKNQNTIRLRNLPRYYGRQMAAAIKLVQLHKFPPSKTRSLARFRQSRTDFQTSLSPNGLF